MHKRTVELDKEIDKMYFQLGSLKSHSTYSSEEALLKGHVEKFNRQILIKKENKFSCDKLAFQENKAYKGHNEYSQRRIKRNRNNTVLMIRILLCPKLLLTSF